MRSESDQRRMRNGSVATDMDNGVVRFRRNSDMRDEGATAAIDLVYQAAELLQSIENRAAETTARAHALAEQAAEQLQSAEQRIRTLDAEKRALEHDLRQAYVRADEAEQAMRTIELQVADLTSRLAGAEQRARDREARTISAEKTLIRIEDAIRTQLLSRGPPSSKRSAAA
jgi:chromosome segregation ATPase